MHVLILGAAGMVGKLLARQIAKGAFPVSRLTLIDIAGSSAPTGVEAEVINLDCSGSGAAERIAALRPELIFHLAAVVSGEAERDFDKGYAVNLASTDALLRALREYNVSPRIVFASSLAVFGPPLPDRIPDFFRATPASSYGTQKAMAELLFSDYSRKGFIEAISLRLPTVVVRPGRPNAAASGFFSGIIREPLAGLQANLPVPDSTRVFIVSPMAIVSSLIHAASLPSRKIAGIGPINLPGISVSVEEMLEALRDHAGSSILELISREPDDEIRRIVDSWPIDVEAETATKLGFAANADFQEILKEHIDERASGG
ncbi:MAG: NAD-dependent epimerase/dehydratase family protein [Albidovulum sp.]|nr:NAD-dependent epimerase/dehydratase family protein [Albidovulum sp.]